MGMRILILLAIGLLIAGCTSNTTPPANNSTITPPSDNTTVTPPGNNTTTPPGNTTPPPDNIPPGYEVKDYCEKDADCVRLNSCCDCGPGQYVNTYNQQAECQPGEPVCKCAIQLSHGECQDNRCVAVADAMEHPDVKEGVTLWSGHGECLAPQNPVRQNMDWGIMLNGSVPAPNPCYAASVLVSKVDGVYRLNITTKSVQTGYCPSCSGAVPWKINITGYYDRVEVYYGSKKVFPDTAGFCGTSTLGACTTDSDCVTGGCSAQVCQAASEEPVITTCEWRDCYDSQSTGVGCGCVAGKCQWH
jgi:eight-cysteine-cluster-containing protein